MSAASPFFPKLSRPVAEWVPLAPHTTWRIGGPARWLVFPSTVQEMSHLVQNLAGEIPWLLLGGGSNVLIDDAGFQGVVMDLAPGMNQIRMTDPWTIAAEAGVSTRTLAHFARRHGLTGAEFLAGIPGSVGGALRMNAGAYGGDMRQILQHAQVMDPTGQCHDRTPQELAMSYRRTQLPSGWFFVSGHFRLQPGDPERIRHTMRDFNQRRRHSQPLQYPSAGSVFCNPATGPGAWQLIDAVGLRGVRQGGAQVAEKHCNFILNRGGARSGDILTLIDLIREKVLKKSHVGLELEVRIVSPNG
ncbi:MAG: UDP-N-acetylmuramate dehydrogenase [Magnetococcales bacterium]|nr:UDP-N-acetylmuramate dehydrogenase [Magnetococcales bacterium]MBF0323148.1 UDP-N-acetylmuramate dehydrogenase [Magnetococcales bacterium]